MKWMEMSGRRQDFFFSSRRRHTRLQGDWSSDVCSSDLGMVFNFITSSPTDSIERPLAAPVTSVQGQRQSLKALLPSVTPIILLGRGGIYKIGRASCRERV